MDTPPTAPRADGRGVPEGADGADGTGRGREYDATPRWVKVFAVIGAVLVLLVAVVLIAGGNHGPGRHQGARDLGHAATGGAPWW